MAEQDNKKGANELLLVDENIAISTHQDLLNEPDGRMGFGRRKDRLAINIICCKPNSGLIPAEYLLKSERLNQPI